MTLNIYGVTVIAKFAEKSTKMDKKLQNIVIFDPLEYAINKFFV